MRYTCSMTEPNASDILRDAARTDARAEFAQTIATARRYGVTDRELSLDFGLIMRGPEGIAQLTASTRPSPTRPSQRPRHPGTGDIDQ